MPCPALPARVQEGARSRPGRALRQPARIEVHLLGVAAAGRAGGRQQQGRQRRAPAPAPAPAPAAAAAMLARDLWCSSGSAVSR
jgi:hypothetical protein